MSDTTFGPGVFARNHLPYLRRAQAKRVLFRSQKRWSGARALLHERGRASIYFCPIGGDGRVHYAGRLLAVELDPSPDTLARLETELGARDVTTGREALWDGTCQTLYVVEVEQLREPFPMTELEKLSGEGPLSADYGYGYSLVDRPSPAS